VHRDLKSLNLLLDSKWNVKVSDFGLTKFKEDMEKHRPNRSECGLAGSIHWTAPELINQSPCVDLALADVYSFGVILWELLTRQQPYAGMRYIDNDTTRHRTRPMTHALMIVWLSATRL
jgi:serine/threonine protein kinase